MADTFPLRVIARMRCDFPTKFGVPRQSGLVAGQTGTVVFEPAFRDDNALRGLTGYSHIWLIWGFSGVQPKANGWSPTVKPPRLGGNKRMGVFATRSPNRPNPIGLSSVQLTGMEKRDGLGTVLCVAGADLMDGTPIYDIKPYLPFTDSHPAAASGFAGERLDYALAVDFPEALLCRIPPEKRGPLVDTLAQDPRPAYRDDPAEPFGFLYAGFDVRFTVLHGVLTVFDVAKNDARPPHVK